MLVRSYERLLIKISFCNSDINWTLIKILFKCWFVIVWDNLREEIDAENSVYWCSTNLDLRYLLLEAFRRLNLDPDRFPQTQTNGDRGNMEVETLEPELMEVSISTELVRLCKIIKTFFEQFFWNCISEKSQDIRICIFRGNKGSLNRFIGLHIYRFCLV